MNEVIERK
ncbi:hypothetical protein D043_0800A, partial [Vibrio parahaemolyticus EKP-021]